MPLTLTKNENNQNVIQTTDDQGSLRELRITGGGSTALTFTTSGNVGIGTTEPDPSKRLVVSGDINISGTATMTTLYVGELWINGEQVIIN